jgi:hypothetical protein
VRNFYFEKYAKNKEIIFSFFHYQNMERRVLIPKISLEFYNGFSSKDISEK